MITDQDIIKLKKTFATKKDVLNLKDEFGDWRVEVGELNDKVDSLAERMDSRFDSIDIKFERMFARMDILDTENKAGAVAQNRHDRQIAALAKHTGARIPE